MNIFSLVLGTDRRLPSLLGRMALGLMALALTAAAPGDVRLRTEPLSIATAKGVARFTVEIADTDASRERGLMFRKSLGAHEGMLFDFQTPQSVSFWMKNTYIPLDMVFIAADGRIVSIARNAVPFDESPIYSGGAVTGVLEIHGGRAAEIGAEPGDLVTARMFHR